MLRARRLLAVCALPGALSASLFAAGCAGALGPVPIGGDDADAFVLADTPAMAHIAAALEGEEGLTLGALIEKGDGVSFSSTPNPTKLLTNTNTLDDNRARGDRQPLTVLSYNVALLDVDLFNIIPYTESPNIPQRRRVLPGLIFETGADIVLLQELWLAQDVDTFTSRALSAGYHPFGHERRSGNDGLIIFVREDVIAGGSTHDVEFKAYASQVGTEYWPGPGIARGWMSVRFVHNTIGEIRVFNTHMQAFPENWLGRVKQARELGIEMQQETATTGAFVLVGGDLNAGPYYKNSTWTSPDASTVDRWFHNAISYPTLLTYGNLVDAAIMGRPAVETLADITLGDTVRNDSTRALEFPGAEDGWCERTPAVTFTATDCNGLYFQQYGGTESPARLDHIFVSDVGERVVVNSSEIVFTDKRTFGDVVVEPSDHFGIRVDLLVSPRR